MRYTRRESEGERADGKREAMIDWENASED